MKTYINRIRLILIVMAVLFQNYSNAQNSNRSEKPLEVVMDDIFKEYDTTPGVAIGVYKDGEILFKKGYGFANLDYDIPMTSETIFDLSSASLQFIAAGIVILENEGKLSLDDPIQKYIPEMPRYLEGEVTIRNCLHHTSGLRDYLRLIRSAGKTWNTTFNSAKGLKMLIRQKALNFAPGSKYAYSDSGYLVLSIIIERISGMSIAKFLKQEIFQPLGMNNTFIYSGGDENIKNRAIGYSPSGDSYKRDHYFDFNSNQVYTNVLDLFKWNENFKKNVIGNETFIDKMLAKGKLKNGNYINYALGLDHGVYKGLDFYAHSGYWGGFRHMFLRFPGEDLGIMILSNNGSLRPFTKAVGVAKNFLQGKFNDNTNSEKQKVVKKGKELSSKILKNYEGYYFNSEAAYSRKIYLENDTLRYFRSEGNISKLIPTSKTEFRIHGSSFDVTFTFKENAGVKLMLIKEDNIITSRYENYKPITYKKDELDKFTGEYYNEELDVIYQLKIHGGKLKIFIDSKEFLTYTPAYKDVFYTEHFGYLNFSRNKDGRIKSFTVSSKWMGKFDFKRT